jgi:hypothetical protein
VPSLQTTSGSDVLGDDVRGGKFRRRRTAWGTGKRRSEDEGNKDRERFSNHLDPLEFLTRAAMTHNAAVASL